MATIPEALSIAVQHHQAGRLEAAEQIYRQILTVQPNHAHANHLLGLIAHQVGNHELAVEYIGRAIALKGTEAAFFNSQGEAYRNLRKVPEAVACFRRALELRPDFAEAHSNLGIALKDQGKLDEAVACFQRALAVNPDSALAHANLANALHGQGKADDAVASFRRALAMKPESAETHCNLGNALKDQGKLAEAVACYRQALALKPDFAMAYGNLGNALKDQGNLQEAISCYRRALELKPNLTDAHNNLANAFNLQGKLDEASACYRKALERDPRRSDIHSNYVYSLNYQPGITLAGLASAHAEWERQHALPLKAAWQTHGNVRDPARPLRLGFVSANFRRHPLGYSFIRAFEALDVQETTTICYSSHFRRDDLTKRFMAASGTWREVRELADAALAEQIRRDAVDILIDLDGHTAGNRLLTFARKPAPVQVTWLGLGSEGTTGLQAIDYILADRFRGPDGTDEYYQEEVRRLPDGFACFDPLVEAPALEPPPALAQRRVTFGSFNKLAKINPDVVRVWSQILRRLGSARLVLKYRGLDDAATRCRYAELFAAHDIGAGRLEFSGWSSYRQTLAEYNQIDIALDPFPFSGGATTCDLLWMGVPLITCPGETPASRHSLSHLSNLGLTEMVAGTLDEYVELAVSLAGDLPRLATLRAGLRERMAASPLCDGKRFAANLMKVLREIWKQSIH